MRNIPAFDGLRIKSDTGLDQIDNDNPDGEGEGCDNLKIDQCLSADAPHLFQITHIADADDDSKKDNRRDQHFDQFNENVRQHL